MSSDTQNDIKYRKKIMVYKYTSLFGMPKQKEWQTEMCNAG